MIARVCFLSILLAYCTSAPAGNPCVDGTGGISADPNDNSKFLKCHLDVAFSQSCPPGLVFNAASNICDWPSSSASKPASPVSNSQAEFSSLNFASQNFPTTTFQPITTFTQFIFSTSNQHSEFSNLNFGGETFPTTLSPVFTSFSSLDPVTFASATESSVIATSLFNVPTSTQSSNFGIQEFQTASVQTQFTTVSPFEVVTESNSQFFEQTTTTTKKNDEKVFMSFKPTVQTNLVQQETTTSFSQLNGISETTMVSNVVEQASRPKQTVVDSFIFEEVDKNHKIDRNQDRNFVQATRISNIALVPTVDLPKRTKEDKKVKISLSDLNNLVKNQVKTSTFLNVQDQIEPEHKVPITTTTTSIQSSDYDYDYEEQIMTTAKSRITPQHLRFKTKSQTVSTIPTTTTLSATTIVDHLIFENIVRNPNKENEQSVSTSPIILHDQNFGSNREKIAKIGDNQEQFVKTTTLSNEDYYYYEEETTTPITTTTRRSKHLRKRPHKTRITTTTTTTTTTTSTPTTTAATTASVKNFDDYFGDFEISSSTSPSFDFINDELDTTTQMPLREMLRIKTTTDTSTSSHSEKNMFSLDFDEPVQKTNRFNEKVSKINQISNSNLPTIDFTVNSDRLETSTNLPSFDISEPRDEIDFSRNTLRRNKFKKKLMEKMTTPETPMKTSRKTTTQTRLGGFDFPSFDIMEPTSTQEKLGFSKTEQNQILKQGSNKDINENLALFDNLEDDSIDRMRNSEKSTTVSPFAESISFNFLDDQEKTNLPAESKKNSIPNFEIVEIKTTTRFSQFDRFPTQAPKVEKFGSFNFEPIPRHN